MRPKAALGNLWFLFRISYLVLVWFRCCQFRNFRYFAETHCMRLETAMRNENVYKTKRRMQCVSTLTLSTDAVAKRRKRLISPLHNNHNRRPPCFLRGQDCRCLFLRLQKRKIFFQRVRFGRKGRIAFFVQRCF